METAADLLALIRRGIEKPVTMELKRTRSREPQSHFGWVIRPRLFTVIEATWLTIHRDATSVHASREGEDVLRGSGDIRWLFEGRKIPARVSSADLAIMNGTRWFLDPAAVIPALKLAHTDMGLISPGRIAGRDTWIVRSAAHSQFEDDNHPMIIEVDQEYGYILAIDSASERIEAAHVDFPDSLPDPSWEGTATDWKEDWESRGPSAKESTELPAVHDVPGFVSEFSLQSEDPRRMRIFIGDGSLEGEYPRFKVGESVRLPLAFRTGQPPVDKLETTRRGWVRNLDEPRPDPLWPIIFTGDGWSAFSYTPTPVIRETELHGWFSYSAEGPESVWNDVLIERVYAGVGRARDSIRIWQELDDTVEAYRNDGITLRDVIVDITLDGAVAPALEPLKFRVGSTYIDGGLLWQTQWFLPVLRCWNITTGRYLGQTFIPLTLHQPPRLHFSPGIVHDGTQAWALSPGSLVATAISDWTPPVAPVAAKEPPACEPIIPEPWEFLASFPDGLLSLSALHDEGTDIALARVRVDGELDIYPLDTGGMSIKTVTRIGDRYFVDCWQLYLVLGPDFRVESVESAPLDPPWSWKASQGVAVDTVNQELVFLRQDSGDELTRFTVPAGHRANVEISSPTRFIVLIHPVSERPWEKPVFTQVAIFDGQEWNIAKLESAPPEI